MISSQTVIDMYGWKSALDKVGLFAPVKITLFKWNVCSTLSYAVINYPYFLSTSPNERKHKNPRQTPCTHSIYQV